ncbi:MAG: hypothetical protein ABFR05_13755, partial [Bacteroidota bacterium]
MKTKLFVGLILIGFYSCSTRNDQGQLDEKSPSPWSQLVNTEFPESYPTEESVEVLYDEMIFQRATQS